MRAIKRLLTPSPSSMATSHRSMSVCFSTSLCVSVAERLLKSEMRAYNLLSNAVGSLRALRAPADCTYAYVETAVEPLAKLAAGLVVVAGEELVGRELEARVGRLGAVERGEDKLQARAY